MSLLSDEFKFNVKSAWLNILQSLFGFPPFQRVVLVVCLILIVPCFWLTKFVTKSYFNYEYGKSALVSHPSFSNPQPLILSSVKVFALGNGSYMAYEKVTNPNLDLSVFNAFYTFSFRNSKSEVIYKTKGQLYVLPGSDQYVIASAFSLNEQVKDGLFEVSNIHWQKRLSVPEVKITTPAALVSSAPEINGIKVEGSLVNQSPYDLNSVTVTFILKSAKGEAVGVAQREERTVRSGERREFPQLIPGISPESVSTVETFVSTNVLDATNLQTGQASGFGGISR